MTKRRRSSGAALLTVLVIGAAAIAFLLALATIVTSAVRASSANKWTEAIRNAAEIGIDYAVDKYNTIAPCSLEPDPTSPDPTKTTPLPASELQAVELNGATPTTGVPTVSVSIKVTRLLNASDWKTLENLSSAYSPQLDPNKSESHGWFDPPAGNLTQDTAGGFRVIESTATNGLISRTIRVVLRAQFSRSADGGGLGSGTSTPNQSFFNRPLFANTTLALAPANGRLNVTDNNNNEIIDQPGGPVGSKEYKLNLSTNQIATIGDNTTVTGNVTVTSLGSTASQSVASITGNGIINGTLTTNGNYDSSILRTPDSSGFTPGDNVLALADGPSRTIGGRNYIDPALDSQSQSQNQLAPIQQPSSANYLGSLEAVADSGTTISGDYRTTGLDSTNVSTSIPVDNFSTPARFFIDSSTGGDSAVKLNSNTFSPNSTNPRNMQIWYEGNKPVTLNIAGNQNFYGVIYAPNAPVTLSGNGDFTGALVGKSVNVTLSGNLKIQTDLANSPSQGNSNPNDSGNQNTAAGLTYLKGTDGSVIQGWQPISWQEFNPTAKP